MKARKAAHAAILLIAALPWIVAYFSACAAAGCGWLAARVWPDADRGNCWSFALHRWCKGRGVLALTFVEDARLLRIFPVVHCALLPSLPREAQIEMTIPRKRRSTQWLPWWAFYFRYRVVRSKPRGE